jgi:hypothetical protein
MPLSTTAHCSVTKTAFPRSPRYSRKAVRDHQVETRKQKPKLDNKTKAMLCLHFKQNFTNHMPIKGCQGKNHLEVKSIPVTTLQKPKLLAIPFPTIH